jgi:hypothetical protein
VSKTESAHRKPAADRTQIRFIDTLLFAIFVIVQDFGAQCKSAEILAALLFAWQMIRCFYEKAGSLQLGGKGR